MLVTGLVKYVTFKYMWLLRRLKILCF